MCISIMCPKGSIPGPGVKVAVEFARPSRLLLQPPIFVHFANLSVSLTKVPFFTVFQYGFLNYSFNDSLINVVKDFVSA